MRRNLRVSGLATALAIVLSMPLIAGGAGASPVRVPGGAGPSKDGGVLRDAPPKSLRTSRVASAPSDPETRPSAPAREHPRSALLVHLSHATTVRARPDGASRAIGTAAASSKYYHVPLVAWIEQVSPNGRWGRVQIPYSSPRRDGWILIAGLRREHTWISVDIDLSRHRVSLERRGHAIYSARAAIGAPSTPTPPGEYFVTDRVPFSLGSSYGSFAFGISGIQPNLPAGWTGGNQLAIHGTNDPWSIGRSVSAGCIRVSETTLHRLGPLLRLGTPVAIHP